MRSVGRVSRGVVPRRRVVVRQARCVLSPSTRPLNAGLIVGAKETAAAAVLVGGRVIDVDWWHVGLLVPCGDTLSEGPDRAHGAFALPKRSLWGSTDGRQSDHERSMSGTRGDDVVRSGELPLRFRRTLGPRLDRRGLQPRTSREGAPVKPGLAPLAQEAVRTTPPTTWTSARAA